MNAQGSREQVFRALHQIAVAVGGILEPVELARLVVGHARDLLNAGAVGVYSFDEATQLLNPIYSSDALDSEHQPPVPLGTGAAGRALLLGEPVLVEDYRTWPYASTWAAVNGVRSAMAVPLQVADRRTGAVAARMYAPRHWTDADAQTLTLLAAQIAPVLEGARLYERTRTARLQAEAAIKLRDEVLVGVTHDLAGPLSRIRVYAELIQSESANAPRTDSAEHLNLWSERIIAATSTMKAIMQEVVDVARLQMGQALQLDQRPTDLVALARRLVDEHQAAGRLVTLETTADELLGWWDEGRLARVVGNLIDNALKYSPPDAGILVTADAVREREAEVALLRVRDPGRGIPPAEVARVFERFYRGSNVAEQTTGSGLGLAVARQIVEQHGGSIDIDSQLGIGTVVSLRLPREPLT